MEYNLKADRKEIKIFLNKLYPKLKQFFLFFQKISAIEEN